MTKGDDTRQRMLDATGALVRQKGVRSTSLSEVLAASGAPRGSLYFHFPAGKDELICAALAQTASAWKEALEQTLDLAPSLPVAIRAICALLGQRLASSGFRDGCPLATATLEAASEIDDIQHVARTHYGAWETSITGRLEAAGHPAAESARLARFALASIEGALLLARAYRDPAPLESVGEMLAELVARPSGTASHRAAPGELSRPAAPRGRAPRGRPRSA
jgi:TetR/AcrR family transcriptional repressor of lmrAB and yxaGH operons